MSDPYGRQDMPYGMPPYGRPAQLPFDHDRRQAPNGLQHRGAPPRGMAPQQYNGNPPRSQQGPMPNPRGGPRQQADPRSQQGQRAQRPTGNNGFLEPPRPGPSHRDRSQPNFIPQYADASAAQSSPTGHGPGMWNDDGYAYPSPNSSRPVTDASMASTTSQYSNPDTHNYDAQTIPPLPPAYQTTHHRAPPPAASSASRQRIPLGPPPSARRGPSSYYPQTLQPVMPIEEESDSQKLSARGSERPSFASSNAIPIGVPDHYLRMASDPRMQSQISFVSTASDYDDASTSQPPFLRGVENQGRDSPPVLLRQASLGRRSKPTLTTVKPGEHPSPSAAHHRTLSEDTYNSVDDKYESLAARSAIGSDLSARPIPKVALPATHAPSGRPRALSDSSIDERSSFDSNDLDLSRYKSRDYYTGSNADKSPSHASRKGSNTGDYEKGGLTTEQKIKAAQLQQPSTLSARVGAKRPPRLNVEAVRRAEHRGSLTSLNDLIRRATKLATNLDRGRTASRLGLDWMGGGAGEGGERAGYDKARVPPKNRKSADSMSDMLSAFPPPAVGTPQSAAPSKFAWPSHLREEKLIAHTQTNEQAHRQRGSGHDEARGERRPVRRVCGMPLWVFLLCILIVFLLIAAAVIVPIMLVVIPKQRAGSASNTLATCQRQLSCKNSGTAILGNDNSCRCLCVNGFTGAECASSGGSNCTGVTAGSTTNATVGDALPRLLTAAQSNYSISLDNAQIVSLISSANLSCITTNGLVSLNGSTGGSSAGSAKKRSATLIRRIADMLDIHEHPSRTLDRRQAATQSSSGAATSEGIIYALGGPPTSSGGSATTPSSGSSTTTTNANTNTSSAELDFARVAILYVLQDSSQLNTAIAAQNALQTWFAGSSAIGLQSSNLTLSNGYSIDLKGFRLSSGNGTVVGKGQ